MAQPVGLWDLIACDGSGNTLANLTRHQGTSFTYVRNGVPECQFTLSHDDAECATILTALARGTGGGVPTLKAYRTGRDGAKTLRFNGYLATISEESGVDASSATFTFRGPFGRYMGAPYFSGSSAALIPRVYTNTDAGVIAKDLIDWANTYLFGVHNIAPPITTTGTIQTTKARDRTYASGTDIGNAIVNLTSVLDGFDFEVAPLINSGVTLGQLNIYASMGSDKPAAKFEYGPTTLANCSAIHRQTINPINYVFVLGAGNLYGYARDPNSWDQYQAWGVAESQSDVSEQATLDDKANALLRPNPIKTIDFTPEPSVDSCPLPWDDYWIGDTVRFYANRGALVEGPLSVRVNQIRVVIDPDTGLESAEIPDPVTDDEERVLKASLQTEVV